jgi:hypothetical protein
VPVGVRRFLAAHEVHTFLEMVWHPQLENGELLRAAEVAFGQFFQVAIR